MSIPSHRACRSTLQTRTKTTIGPLQSCLLLMLHALARTQQGIIINTCLVPTYAVRSTKYYVDKPEIRPQRLTTATPQMIRNSTTSTRHMHHLIENTGY
ncbi:hypothetical protein BO78DRAFT_221126 [Aspergillus sclerotiicarbonarius CBS 121057]|uniref:Uncharacterized protein n=1 Tax=Aspergillus sclerotiicarbonarius (strain CBS 121057 / IBT 28362) TaxID=1448318 RepID=A0A319EJJ9_ASPSB|nr:hypothetical protein BO78DRAFT_221126 [Aspergillus sclerotiicarbonarius CBS 121057]